MVSSLLYAVYAVAAWAALAQGTRVAAAAGAVVAGYLVVRLAGVLSRLAHRSAAGVPAPALAQPLGQPQPLVRPAPGTGRP
jgi:hypothetical protein